MSLNEVIEMQRGLPGNTPIQCVLKGNFMFIGGAAVNPATGVGAGPLSEQPAGFMGPIPMPPVPPAGGPPPSGAGRPPVPAAPPPAPPVPMGTPPLPPAA